MDANGYSISELKDLFSDEIYHYDICEWCGDRKYLRCNDIESEHDKDESNLPMCGTGG
jgi:hypothetical protein